MHASEKANCWWKLDYGCSRVFLVKICSSSLPLADGVLLVNILGGRVDEASWYPSNLDECGALDGEDKGCLDQTLRFPDC
jgi:hypothetical protein